MVSIKEKNRGLISPGKEITLGRALAFHKKYYFVIAIYNQASTCVIHLFIKYSEDIFCMLMKTLHRTSWILWKRFAFHLKIVGRGFISHISIN